MFSWQLVIAPPSAFLCAAPKWVEALTGLIFPCFTVSVCWLQSECSPSFGTNTSRLFSLLSHYLPSATPLEMTTKAFATVRQQARARRDLPGDKVKRNNSEVCEQKYSRQTQVVPAAPTTTLESVMVVFLVRSPTLQFNKHNEQTRWASSCYNNIWWWEGD